MLAVGDGPTVGMNKRLHLELGYALGNELLIEAL